ncbi:MAG: hypothetical protein JWM98_2846 [Thermoleophilia bacterium]|nr:hypothetical protein [Thermoleophilia bacterium]
MKLVRSHPDMGVWLIWLGCSIALVLTVLSRERRQACTMQDLETVVFLSIGPAGAVPAVTWARHSCSGGRWWVAFVAAGFGWFVGLTCTETPWTGEKQFPYCVASGTGATGVAVASIAVCAAVVAASVLAMKARDDPPQRIAQTLGASLLCSLAAGVCVAVLFVGYILATYEGGN